MNQRGDGGDAFVTVLIEASVVGHVQWHALLLDVIPTCHHRIGCAEVNGESPRHRFSLRSALLLSCSSYTSLLAYCAAVGRPHEFDHYYLSWLQRRIGAQRLMTVGVKGQHLTYLSFQRQAVVFQNTHQTPGNTEHVARL